MGEEKMRRMEKKFYRSKTDKKLCGVCGGLAEYLNMDVNILRVLWVLVTLFAGAGLLAYIIIALIVPEKPEAGGGAVHAFPKDRKWEMTAARTAVHRGSLGGEKPPAEAQGVLLRAGG